MADPVVALVERLAASMNSGASDQVQVVPADAAKSGLAAVDGCPVHGGAAEEAHQKRQASLLGGRVGEEGHYSVHAGSQAHGLALEEYELASKAGASS